MSKTQHSKRKDQPEASVNEEGMKELRQSAMMAHLLDALQQGTDIGHYGRLTFVTVETEL